ncbi:uncharacterized protein LOC119360665 [Triticum dicoccoides]|uniref:uncharacterized protein LOC119360665 n=1 Tax=Triticum dicoccoides TaxID=85692 RepID=UPI00188DE2FF|nr:uncharacterized protein LOC119360665 [Triticum dicoccoides]
MRLDSSMGVWRKEKKGSFKLATLLSLLNNGPLFLSWATNLKPLPIQLIPLVNSPPTPRARAASMAAGPAEALKSFEERASDAEARLAKLEALLLNKDGPSEASSSAMRDLESKLDATTKECLAEKEQNRKLAVENEKLQYRVSHLIRTIKEAEAR